MATRNEIPPKELIERGAIYLKGVKVANISWFRAEAERLGYGLNEFFDIMIEAIHNDSKRRKPTRNGKKPRSKTKTSD